MEWDKVVEAAVSLLFGFVGGMGVLFTMRSDIANLKEQMKESKIDRQELRSLLREEIKDLRSMQERHYMNLSAMIQRRPSLTDDR